MYLAAHIALLTALLCALAGSAVGVSKDNAELLAGVNEAIAAAISDGSMAKFVAEAGELANGETYEGLLDAEGNVQG